MQNTHLNRQIKVVETFSKGKVDQRENEDGFFISDDFVVVVDGVSSKSDFLYQGKKTGKLAMEAIIGMFENNAIKKDANIEEIISKVNLAFAQFYDKITFQYDKEKYGLQAMAAIYSKYYHTVWLVGDCQALIDGISYENPKQIDLVLSEFRSLVNHIELDKNPSSDIQVRDVGREVILPWIGESTRFMNNSESEYGYSVFNGDPIPVELIKTIKLTADKTHIILTSDGYPIVEDSLAKTEAALEHVIQVDPLCINEFKSTKGKSSNQLSFDDRTYVKFVIEI